MGWGFGARVLSRDPVGAQCKFVGWTDGWKNAWMDGRWMHWSRLQFSGPGAWDEAGTYKTVEGEGVSRFGTKILQAGEQMGCGWQECEDSEMTRDS